MPGLFLTYTRTTPKFCVYLNCLFLICVKISKRLKSLGVRGRPLHNFRFFRLFVYNGFVAKKRVFSFLTVKDILLQLSCFNRGSLLYENYIRLHLLLRVPAGGFLYGSDCLLEHDCEG